MQFNLEKFGRRMQEKRLAKNTVDTYTPVVNKLKI
jgi:hypothetical protein